MKQYIFSLFYLLIFSLCGLCTSCDGFFVQAFKEEYIDSVSINFTFYLEDPSINPSAPSVEKKIFVKEDSKQAESEKLKGLPEYFDPIFSEWNQEKGENFRIIDFEPIIPEETINGYYKNYMLVWGVKYIVQHKEEKEDGRFTEITKTETRYGKVGNNIEYEKLYDGTYLYSSGDINSIIQEPSVGEDCKTYTIEWKRASFTVSFGKGEGEFPSEVYAYNGFYNVSGKYNKEITLPQPPTKQGKYFIGWQDQATGTIYTLDQIPLKFTEDKTYIAIFAENPISIETPIIKTHFIEQITENSIMAAKIGTPTTLKIPITEEAINCIKTEDGKQFLSYQIGTSKGRVQIIKTNGKASVTLNLNTLTGTNVDLETGILNITLSADPIENQIQNENECHIYLINSQEIIVVLMSE